jgi:hypothetical protein
LLKQGRTSVLSLIVVNIRTMLICQTTLSDILSMSLKFTKYSNDYDDGHNQYVYDDNNKEPLSCLLQSFGVSIRGRYYSVTISI